MKLLAALAWCAALSSLDAQQALHPYEARKALTLLRTKLPCLGCHELDGDGGSTAPSLSTVGTRRSAAYIRGIIGDPQRTLPGAAMPRHPMPAADRELVVRLLAQGARGADVPVMPPPQSTAASNGASMYAKWCAGCHGPTGNGDGPNAARLPVRPATHADASAMSRRSDDALYDVIAVGGLPYGRSARMPAFGASLSSAEIRALVAQIRMLCRCEGPAWSRNGPMK